MSKPDKPIFNQPGGRGKLYGPTHGATYMGTYQMPDGKIDRRMFNCATNKDAIKAYTDWCGDMDARILEAMKEKVRPKAKAQQPKEKPAYTEPFKKDEAKGVLEKEVSSFSEIMEALAALRREADRNNIHLQIEDFDNLDNE